jgi:copper chaperone CopZ
MKALKFILLSITFVCFSLPAKTQNVSIKTATFVVKGNCEECKKRIENAADITGVKFAEWNEDKQLMSVTYRADKVTLQQIEQAVAAKGHDTQGVKSDDKAYKSLPECCQYRDKNCEKPKK